MTEITFDKNIIVQDYEGKIKIINTKVQNGEELTIEDRSVISNYYSYLQDVGIVYGEAAYQMVNNEGNFGIIGNRYFELYLENNTNYNTAEIASLKDEFMVNLALADIELRKEASNGFIDYDAIGRYHYSVLEKMHLDREAWGGSFLETFGGTGTVFDLGSFDTSFDISQSDLIWALVTNETKNGVNARKSFEALWNAINSQPEQTIDS